VPEEHRSPQLLLDPPGEYSRVSPRLTVVEELGNLGWTVLFVAVTAIPLVLNAVDVWPGYPTWLSWLVPAAILAYGIVAAIVIPFSVRRRRYSLREDDFVAARGVIWHRIEVVPYGRIQYVDMTAGPVLRAFGLTRIKIHTAATDTHPEVLGITADEGARLRDELARRGEQRQAGL
jgi:membrane protein YdbS with pleckstrin-like domain